MKNERIELLKKVANGELTPKQADKQLWGLFAVSGSFSQEDMENFAAKCMILGHGGKTTKELLQDFCDNDR